MYTTLLKPLLNDCKQFVLDTLFPIKCLACGAEGEFICFDCKVLLKSLEHQRCIACQKPSPFGLTHSYCQMPHGADALISFYDYHDEKIAGVIIGGKYKFIPEAYKILGLMIAEKIKGSYPELPKSDDYNPLPELIPIPLHSSRLRWRGFNQAEILCRTLSEELRLPLGDALLRRKITKTQKDLKKEQRLKNVTGAFILKKGADVKRKNLILVDDVTTTGATLQEAAKVLKRNGAKKVVCLTVARD